MFHTLARPRSARWVPGIFSLLGAAAVLLGMPGSSQADARSDARATVAKIKANINQANTEISSRQSRIFAGELLIAANEIAIGEAKKKENNQAAVLVLEIALVALKSKKNELIKERQDWERFLQSEQRVLPQWEAELRRLGG